MSMNPPASAAKNAAARRENAPRENLDKWFGAMQSGAPEALAALYDEAATFLPTLSSECKRGRAETDEYFDYLLKIYNRCEIVEENVQWLDDDTYLHSGFYDFCHIDGSSTPARFTFIWEHDGSRWRIIHHHSSLKPGAA